MKLLLGQKRGAGRLKISMSSREERFSQEWDCVWLALENNRCTGGWPGGQMQMK